MNDKCPKCGSPDKKIKWRKCAVRAISDPWHVEPSQSLRSTETVPPETREHVCARIIKAVRDGKCTVGFAVLNAYDAGRSSSLSSKEAPSEDEK